MMQAEGTIVFLMGGHDHRLFGSDRCGSPIKNHLFPQKKGASA